MLLEFYKKSNTIDSMQQTAEAALSSSTITNTSEAKVAGGASTKYRRSEFLIHEGTGRGVNAKGEKVKSNEYVGFSEPLRKQYSTFLENYLRNIKLISDPRILASPEHRTDREILALLTNEKGEPDNGKIETFLSKPKGWMLTTQLLERQISMKLFALGLVADKLPPGQRQTIGEETTIHLSGEGKLHKLWREKKQKIIAGLIAAGVEIPVVVAGSTLGTAVGAALAGKVGAVIGLALGPVWGVEAAAVGAGGVLAYKGYQSLRQEGITLNIKHSAAVLEMLQGNANEAAFMKAVYGIDVQDFQVTAGNIQLRVGRVPESSGINEIQNEITQQMYARQEFYNTLNIPIENIDALPEQGLFDWTTEGQLESTRSRWQKRLQEIFNPNGGGILDTGLPPGGGAAGPPRKPGDPGFDSNSLDIRGNIGRFNKAREQVMLEMVQSYVEDQRENQSAGKVDAALKTKLADRKENGTLRTKRIQEHTDKKATYDIDKGKMVNERHGFEEYRNILKELEGARQEVAKKLRESLGPGVTNIEDGLNNLRTVLNTSGININIGGVNIPSVFDREDSLMTNLENDYAAGVAALAKIAKEPNEQYEKRVERVDQQVMLRHKGEIERLDQHKKIITDLINELEVLKGKLDSSKAKIADGSVAVESIKTIRENLEKDHGEIVGLGAGAAITNVILTTETNDQIMTRINNTHKANPAEGWPESENTKEENRLKVLHAMAQARVSNAEVADVSRPARLPDYTTITSWDLTENQLRVLTEPELLDTIHRINLATPANGWPPAQDLVRVGELRNAVAEARSIFDKRENAYKDMDGDISTLIKREQWAASAVNFDQEIDLLKTTINLRDNQGEIFTRCFAITADVGKFTDLNRVDSTAANTTDTINEKAPFNGRSLEKGYLEMMDLLFDYRVKPDRNEYFGKLIKVLPPNKLAGIMSEYMGYPPTDPLYTTNLRIALARLRVQVGNGTFATPELQQLTKTVINKFSAEAMAL